eukprot:424069-Alexandrium_andersonii.AAC.1
MHQATGGGVEAARIHVESGAVGSEQRALMDEEAESGATLRPAPLQVISRIALEVHPQFETQQPKRVSDVLLKEGISFRVDSSALPSEGTQLPP